SLSGARLVTEQPLGFAGEPRGAAPSGQDWLERAVQRAQLSILWERLWPALASLMTAVGLFLAVSWLGPWQWLPPLGRAIGLGVFALLGLVAAIPLLRLRFPTQTEALGRLDRNSGLQHRPATAVADVLALNASDPFSVALWRAHLAQAVRA